MTPETYVSVDIESDGPIPGPNSMLSLGAVAFTETGDEIASFSVNLDLLPDAVPDPATTAWWDTQGNAYAYTRNNTKSPVDAMGKFLAWVKALPGVPVFVAYPAGFDYTYVRWYLVRFTGEDPFSFAALDMKTLAMAVLHTPFRKSTKRNFPSRWFQKGFPHTHVALEDAREQGVMFTKMMADMRKLGRDSA